VNVPSGPRYAMRATVKPYRSANRERVAHFVRVLLR